LRRPGGENAPHTTSPNSYGPTPVVVVSGFLGSGKTTLLGNLLRDPQAGEVAVIVNEFGEVGIDHHLVRKTDARTTLLRNGCVCCSLRDDLAEALGDLLSQRARGAIPPFGRVVIETTGLADPAPILQTIVNEPMLRHHFRVGQVVTTIDAVSGEGNLDAYGEALRQVAAADAVIVTKQDLTTPETAAALKTRIAAINPAATILDASFGRIDFAPLLADDPRVMLSASEASRLTSNAASVPPTVHATAGRVETRCFVFAQPLDWQMFGIWLTMLLHRHGDRVLRMKGLLNVGEEKGPLLLEGVQHVIHAPRHLAAWPDEDRRSRLVFIARDLDLDGVEESLHAFQTLAAVV
jgi:G3E family GTPase